MMNLDGPNDARRRQSLCSEQMAIDLIGATELWPAPSSCTLNNKLSWATFELASGQPPDRLTRRRPVQKFISQRTQPARDLAIL